MPSLTLSLLSGSCMTRTYCKVDARERANLHISLILRSDENGWPIAEMLAGRKNPLSVPKINQIRLEFHGAHTEHYAVCTTSYMVTAFSWVTLLSLKEKKKKN